MGEKHTFHYIYPIFEFFIKCMHYLVSINYFFKIKVKTILALPNGLCYSLFLKVPLSEVVQLTLWILLQVDSFRGRQIGTENTKPHFHENSLLKFSYFGTGYKILKCTLFRGAMES